MLSRMISICSLLILVGCSQFAALFPLFEDVVEDEIEKEIVLDIENNEHAK